MKVKTRVCLQVLWVMLKQNPNTPSRAHQGFQIKIDLTKLWYKQHVLLNVQGGLLTFDDHILSGA